MTERWVALLRGINVGRAKQVAMSDLQAALEDLGFEQVRTLLRSGNVLFSGRVEQRAQAAEAMQAALAERTGVHARFTLLRGMELARVVSENPLTKQAEAEPSRLLVGFLSPPRGAGIAEVAAREWAPERLHGSSLALYLWLPGGSADSPLLRALNRSLGDGITTRNWSTTTRLLELC